MKTIKKVAILILLFGFLHTGTISAQNWKELKEKAKKEAQKKLNEKTKPTTTTTTTTPTETNSTNNNAVKEPEPEPEPEVSLLEKITAEQAKIVAENKMQIDDYDANNGHFGPIKSEGDIAYLTFTNDYTKKDANILSFGGKDFIYARLKLDKNISELLPKYEKFGGVEYHRVTIKVNAGNKARENDNKIQKDEFFALAYNTDDILFAVVPEVGFFESITEKYKENGKFKSKNAAIDAYNDILARNFSRQVSYVLKDLSIGEHRVEIEFNLYARSNYSDKYYEVKNIKGVFMVTVDEEAKERYANTFEKLTTLYYEYDDKKRSAMADLSFANEEERLAKMTPREREMHWCLRYSREGHMTCYEGKKVAITIQWHPDRTKIASIDFSWPAGSCAKCEAGSTGINVFSNNSAVFQVPVGAKVSINGRVLIQKVTTAKTVPIYWYY